MEKSILCWILQGSSAHASFCLRFWSCFDGGSRLTSFGFDFFADSALDL